MARIAVLTMSDGRDFVAKDIHDFAVTAEREVAGALLRIDFEGLGEARQQEGKP